ncbi:SRPBCC domain-containing protein [Mucilaginibacter sp. RS28]|uniref:SRPBCC domain-containing protein n=1 Tax=Mucilaginibacter straminoryzae TaxID=2932774 RepID=A0A9X1X8U6_9SPHI|nr:SRPBCC family protein [Mucilaginibacter straminoryzae]MCJ8211858.1 SRPBCC domain-containing protein [Mucilaginibacter straminoryzae]
MKTTQAPEVRVSKEFPVGKDKLYKAWTSEQELKEWWKPLKGKLAHVENDIHEGGKVKYAFENEGDPNYLVIEGNYEVAKPGEQLVYTWNWVSKEDLLNQGHYKLTVNFEDKGNGSSLSVIQEDIDEEEHVYPHHDGWEKSLDDLYHYLAGSHQGESALGSERNNSVQSQNEEGDVAGYNETPDQQKVAGA